MRITDYRDTEGRIWRVWLPDDAPESDAPMGIPVGPPPLDDLDLPVSVAVRLHNELHARGVWDWTVARARPDLVAQSVRAALRLDTQDVMSLYHRMAAGD